MSAEEINKSQEAMEILKYVGEKSIFCNFSGQ